jgi:uncharacterized protein
MSIRLVIWVAAISSATCLAQIAPNLSIVRERAQRELSASSIVGNNNVAITNSSVSVNDPKAIGGVVSEGLRSLTAALRPPLPSADEEIERIRQVEGTGSDRKGAQRALRLYREAAQRGNHLARVHVARLLFDLSDPIADKTAVRELEQSSGRGVAEAFAWLGWTHDAKRRSDATEKEALRLFNEAAVRGDAWAAYKLGITHQQAKLGVSANEELALKWYEQSARSYYAPAILEVAWILAYGQNKHRNDDRAQRLFELSAQMGERAGFYHLGLRFQNGTGVRRDLYRAAENFEKAASLGHLYAQNSLGIIFLGSDAFPRSIEKAVDAFRQAHGAGFIPATVNLGNRYRLGEGVTKNPTEAFRLYMEAATAGNNFSKLFVAEMYRAGEGVQKDTLKALEWFKKAIDAEMSSACVDLGAIYANGLGVDPDYREAAKWLRRGIKLGNETCRNNLAAYINLGKARAEADEVPLEMFRLAAEAGDAMGLNNYGFRLFNGTNITQDIERGTDMLLRAADLGVDSARASVAEIILKRVGRFAKPNPSLALKYLLDAKTKDTHIASLFRDLVLAYGESLTKRERADITPKLEELLASSDADVSRTASIPLTWLHLALDKTEPANLMLLLQRLYESNEAGNGEAGFMAIQLITTKFKLNDAEVPELAKLLIETAAKPSLFQPFVLAIVEGLRSGKYEAKDLYDFVANSNTADELMRDIAQMESLTLAGQSAGKYMRERKTAGIEHAQYLFCRLLLERKTMPVSSAEIATCRQMMPLKP